MARRRILAVSVLVCLGLACGAMVQLLKEQRRYQRIWVSHAHAQEREAERLKSLRGEDAYQTIVDEFSSLMPCNARQAVDAIVQSANVDERRKTQDLMVLYGQASNSSVRGDLAIGLATMGGKPALDFLAVRVRIALADGSPAAVTAVKTEAQLLVRTRNPEFRDVLREILRNPNMGFLYPEVRRTLSEMGEAVPPGQNSVTREKGGQSQTTKVESE